MILKIILGIAFSIILYLFTLSFMTRHHQIKDADKRILQPCPNTPNCVLSTSSINEKSIQPFPVIKGQAQNNWTTFINTIKDQGGEIIVHDSSYLHAVFTSTIFRFKDDLEATLSDDHIDIRSASRAGKSDLGQNRKRIELLRTLYQTQFNGVNYVPTSLE